MFVTVHGMLLNVFYSLFSSCDVSIMFMSLFHTSRGAWQEAHFLYLIWCVCIKYNHIIVSRVVAETWIVHLYYSRTNPPPHTYACLWVFLSVLIQGVPGPRGGGVLNLLHRPPEWISVQLANKSPLFLETGYLLSEYEFSLKHPSLIHFLWFNKLCSHY